MEAITPAVLSPPFMTEVDPSAVDSPPFTTEVNPSAVDSLPREPQQSQELIPNTNSPSNTLPPSKELLTVPLAALSPPSFINSIAELKDLSSSLLAFHQCYEDLHNHIDSIKAAIFSKLPVETLDPKLSPLSIRENITSLPLSALSTTTPLSSSTPIPSSSSLPHKDVSGEKTYEQNPPVSELEGLCNTMCSKSIRRYLITHLSDRPRLREEVPKALKLAPSPAKLVLETLGKFFLQGTRAYAKDSPMIPARDASIFALECFLLMIGMDGNDNGALVIEKSVRDEAESAALGWRKRLVAEGGLDRANQVDARGLLLLIACFGIPNSFRREDIRDIVMAANAKEIVGVLKKSQLLMNKISEIVEAAMKSKNKVDAVDIAYTFGLDDRFDPQIILLSFLQESAKNPKKGSASPLKEALSALKSVRRCLAKHKVDPEKLLPGWQIGEKISTLEKDIAEIEKNLGGEKTQKRKTTSEAETSKKKSRTKEEKRSHYSGIGQSHQNASSHIDNRSRNTMPVNYSSPASVIYGGPGAGLIPESMLGPRVGSGMSLGRDPYSGGVHGGMMVDTVGQVMSRAATHHQPYVYDAALIEKYATQPTQVGLSSLYRPSVSVSSGVHNLSTSAVVGIGNRSSGGSDLYQFADSVVERESYPRNVGTVPGLHTSYLHRV